MSDIRRGKYWESDPDREQKAKEKRERRKIRNIRNESDLRF